MVRGNGAWHRFPCVGIRDRAKDMVRAAFTGDGSAVGEVEVVRVAEDEACPFWFAGDPVTRHLAETDVEVTKEEGGGRKVLQGVGNFVVGKGRG